MLRRVRITFIVLVTMFLLLFESPSLIAASLNFEHDDDSKDVVSKLHTSSPPFSDEAVSFENNLIGDDFFSSTDDGDIVSSKVMKVRLPNEHMLGHIINRVCFYPHLKEKTRIHKDLAGMNCTGSILLQTIQRYWDCLLASGLNSVEFALFKMQREYMVLALVDEILKESPLILEDLKKSIEYEILTEKIQETRERVFHQWQNFFHSKDKRGM